MTGERKSRMTGERKSRMTGERKSRMTGKRKLRMTGCVSKGRVDDRKTQKRSVPLHPFRVPAKLKVNKYCSR